MKSENIKSPVSMLNLTDKTDLRRDEQSIASSNPSIYDTWKNIKSSHNNNKFKMWASTWNDDFPFLDRSCWIPDNYFEYIFKQHG